jgi:uncharacterized protein (DUF1684 family)
MKFHLVICIALLLISCDSISQSVKDPSLVKSDYADSLIAKRELHDFELKTGTSSPLEKSKIASFTGLKYYPPKEKYKILANYTLLDTGQVFELATNTDRKVPIVKHGLISFKLNNEVIKLFAYKYVEHPEADLFVPFLDLTNGDVTYGGGRYIEMKYPANGQVTIDFNTAYNPYCAYNHNYSCPIPPLENSLKIEIPAGEKVLYNY